MVLDLGGIAKGYTADHMLKILKSNKLNRVLIDAGGDLLIGDAPVGKKGWRLKLEENSPRSSTLTFQTSQLRLQEMWNNLLTIAEKHTHTLIDPFTGLALTTECKLQILAQSAMEADA